MVLVSDEGEGEGDDIVAVAGEAWNLLWIREEVVPQSEFLGSEEAVGAILRAFGIQLVVKL